MTENKAVEILKNNFPKTCKMVDGRYKGGFDDIECEFGKALSLSISALTEIQQYREIGTVEDCHGAMERQRAKKPIFNDKMALWDYTCPVCGEPLIQQGYTYNYCDMCGNRIDWSDTD